MILSVSRRTDIPCYYFSWFLNRLKAGYADFRNPVNHRQLYRVPLTPDIVDCIVFWTKDPAPMLEKLPFLDNAGYRYYFQFTVTPYGHEIERNLRDKDAIINTFKALSKQIGAQRVLWRYDPVLIHENFTVNDHKKAFLQLCEHLCGYTRQVTVSFVDLYPKLKSPLVQALNPEQTAELAEFIGCRAKEHGLKAYACCEEGDFCRFGIAPASCTDSRLIEEICGVSMDLKPDYNQRKGCGCCESVDIGAYNTCKNGCAYCYANYSASLVNANFAAHDLESSLLTGRLENGEIPVTKQSASNRSGQLSLF